jgi:hypothetical protein
LEAFITEFKTRNGEASVANIKTDTSAEFVFVKLMDKLKERFQMRPDLIERQQAKALSNKPIPDRTLTQL